MSEDLSGSCRPITRWVWTDRQWKGFSLLEVIGVLSIIAILSAVMAPNVVRSIDRVAVRSEGENLEVLGEQIKLRLRDTGSIPSPSSWATDLADYSDLNQEEIEKNRRFMIRSYIRDTSEAPVVRVLILSSMRDGLDLPSEGDLGASGFDDVWNTQNGDVPSSSSWSGWGSWASVDRAEEYLLIERVNLQSIYLTELKTFTITVNNLSGVSCSYNVVDSEGVSLPLVNLPTNTSAPLTGFQKGERINLYRDVGGFSLGYSYVISRMGKSFDFDGSNWIPQ